MKRLPPAVSQSAENNFSEPGVVAAQHTPESVGMVEGKKKKRSLLDSRALSVAPVLIPIANEGIKITRGVASHMGIYNDVPDNPLPLLDIVDAAVKSRQAFYDAFVATVHDPNYEKAFITGGAEMLIFGTAGLISYMIHRHKKNKAPKEGDAVSEAIASRQSMLA